MTGGSHPRANGHPLEGTLKIGFPGIFVSSLGAVLCPRGPAIYQGGQGDRKHPFSGALLAQTRRTLAEAINLNQHEAEVVAEGQPFHLNLITALATSGDDIDAIYPKDVASGVPLGVTTPIGLPQASGLLRRNSKGNRQHGKILSCRWAETTSLQPSATKTFPPKCCRHL